MLRSRAAQPMRCRLTVVTVFVAALAGCATSVDEPGLSTAALVEPLPVATEPTVIYDGGDESLGGVELDVLCVTGGGVVLTRQDNGSILPGVTHLVGTFSMSAGTGWQLGYRVDEGEIVWIEPLGAGTSTFEIPVEPAHTEEAGERWTFWHQANLPGPAAQDCYTGVILNGWTLRLETALR